MIIFICDTSFLELSSSCLQRLKSNGSLSPEPSSLHQRLARVQPTLFDSSIITAFTPPATTIDSEAHVFTTCLLVRSSR